MPQRGTVIPPGPLPSTPRLTYMSPAFPQISYLKDLADRLEEQVSSISMKYQAYMHRLTSSCAPECS